MKTVSTKFKNFESQINKYLGYDYDERTITTKITIKASNIPKSGFGAFACTKIPKGYCCRYKGKFSKIELDSDNIYVWDIHERKWENSYFTDYKPWSKQTDNVIGWVDGRDSKHWTRFVNCSESDASANIIAKEIGEGVYYITNRDIEPGEEMFIYYGDDYYESIYGKALYCERKGCGCKDSSDIQFCGGDGYAPKSALLCTKCENVELAYAARRGYNFEYDEIFCPAYCQNCESEDDLRLTSDGYELAKYVYCKDCIVKGAVNNSK
jgi:hypothetical protein